jgi:hypothetical protein
VVAVTVDYETFDRSPSPTGLALTVVPAVVAALASAMFLPAAAVALLAVLVLTVGVRNASRRLLTLGAVVLFGAVLLAGATEAPTAFVLAGAGATVVAWDAGTNAVTVGRQLGAAADTRRLEVVHALATTGVAAVVGIVGFGAFRLASGGQPTVGVALLLLAALLFSYLLDS